MDQMRFDKGLGTFSLSVAPESVSISKGMGTHYFQIQLEVGIPQVTKVSGRLLILDTTLYTPTGATGPRMPLASASVSVPFQPEGEVRRPTLNYLITNAQLMALEQQRTNDLRLELQIDGVLAQATTAFPGGTRVTEHISIAESRWRQQLAGLGRTIGAEMLIPFPDDDEPRRAAADFLREAQRLLGGREVDSAMLQVRKALEIVKNAAAWNWPGKKKKGELTAGERWALIRAAIEDQASGAMHVDPGTSNYTYTRTEVETLIAMTAALLRVMTLP